MKSELKTIDTPNQNATAQNSSCLYRLAAFTQSPEGGNPAGVWLGNKLPSEPEMQRIASQVGYSETAFVAPLVGLKRQIRYFSPEAEVPFCGHATVAAGVVIGEQSGDAEYQLESIVGEIPIAVNSEQGIKTTTLTSVTPKFEVTSDLLLKKALAALGWASSELDPKTPSAIAFAGNWHLVIAVKNKLRLDNLNYDFETLKALMLEHELTTLQLIWRESDTVIHSRNPFPVGGVVEDPATGAAAAALGGYLREAGLVEAPIKILVRQGEVMGRPSILTTEIPRLGGIKISGTAVFLEQP